MSDDHDRLAELLGAAAADDLSPAERAELLDVLGDDPEAADHLTDHQDLVAALRSSDLRWRDVEVPAGTRDRVLRQTVGGRRRTGTLLAAAAAAVVLAGAGGYAVGARSDDAPAAVSGGPGTLGAVEPVSFSSVPDGVDVDASLVAHTWGTETVLDVSGLPTGGRYTVVLAGVDGDTLDTGSFVAVPDVTDCRMNGAVPREDVAALRVVDSDGATVMSADLPVVG